MSKKRFCNMVWHTRLDSYPYYTVKFNLVPPHPCQQVEIVGFNARVGEGFGITASRRDARLLAKRINQALDSWHGKRSQK